MIKIVYFDFGGVLTEGGQKGFITALLAELYGVKPNRMNIADYHAELRRGRSHEDELFEHLNQKYKKIVTKKQFLDRAHSDFQPSQAVYDCAAKLRRAGIQTGILSNVFHMNARELRKQGWYNNFDPVILSCEAGYAKPDPEIYELAIKKAGVFADEILLVDDQDKCLDKAKEFGFHTIRAVEPDQIVHDIEKLLKDLNGLDVQ